jgi:hypothetical protein
MRRPGAETVIDLSGNHTWLGPAPAFSRCSTRKSISPGPGGAAHDPAEAIGSGLS